MNSSDNFALSTGAKYCNEQLSVSVCL